MEFSRAKLTKAGVYTLLVIFSVMISLPLFWMVSSSLKPNFEVFSFPPQWIPHPIFWSNYPKALTFVPFFRFFVNTMTVAFSSLVGALVSNILVSYAFARFTAKGKNILFYLILSTLMLPYAVTMIPQYAIFSQIHWVNTFLPLIVPNYFGNPMFIFLLRQFFMGIPKEIEEAAAIDGAGLLYTLWRIIVPMSWPAIVTVCIFQVQGTWNDFLGPLLYLNQESLDTIQLGLNYFIGEYTGSWNYLMAASTVAIVPILTMFYFGQKLFIKGIVVGSLKG